MSKQEWQRLGIAGHGANPEDLEFKPFQRLPVVVEAVRIMKPFGITTPGKIAQTGKPGDWLVRIEGYLRVFTAEQFEKLYSPSTISRISELESELSLLGPLKADLTLHGMRPYSAHDDMPLDISNPPSGGSAATPPPPTFVGPLKPETIAALHRVGAIRPNILGGTWDQPMPTGEGELVAPRARVFFEKVLKEQEAKGLKKYSTPLMTDNGRNALKDLIGELVDAIMYCSQALMEQEAREAEDEQEA